MAGSRATSSSVRRNTGPRIAGLAAAVVLTVGFLLSLPASAAAHLRAGTVAVDYQASIARPDTPAYNARIYQSDRGLSLTLKPGHAVTLIGYVGEPVFRLDAAGMWVNEGSPTALVDGVLPKHTRLSPVSHWRLEPRRTAVSWHDSRTQGLPHGVSRGGWRVPLIVDGHRTILQGELIRPGPPSLLLWLGLLLALLAGTGLPVLRRHDLVPFVATGAATAGGTASAALACVFCLDAYASPGTWIEGVDAIVFLAVGFGVLLRGPRHFHLVAAIGIGLVSLAVGLLGGAVFLHPIVLAVAPGWLVRVLALAAIAGGASAAVLGCLTYAGSVGAAFDTDPDLDAGALSGATWDRPAGD